MSEPKIPQEDYENLGGINSKVSPYKNNQTEFRDLRNVDFRIPNALTSRYGSTAYSGASVTGEITSLYEFQRLNGASYIIATANTNAYTVTNTFTAFRSSLTQGALWDFVTFVDRLFMVDGVDTGLVYDGTNAYKYSIPNGTSGWGATPIVGGGSFVAGTYVFYYGYLNTIGEFGAISNGITLTLGASGCGVLYYGMTLVPDYGLTSSFALYKTESGGIIPTFSTYSIGSSFLDVGVPLSTRIANQNQLFFTASPRYIDLYNNQLFLLGSSQYPSGIFWSDIGKPNTIIFPDYFTEIRTNDGDEITGSKEYQGSLFVFKNRSFGRITGTDPNSLNLDMVNTDFGSISDRTILVWNNNMTFLSEKEIVLYNGANVDDLFSEKIRPFIQDINLQAARRNAVAVHSANENQIWYSIPVNGSTTNNLTLVYDYLVKAWTIFDGFQLKSAIYGYGNDTQKRVIFGGYSGSIFNFGASLFGDNGIGITSQITPAFLAQRGETVETQYRRFYINVNPVGTTEPIQIDFRINYGSSIVLSRTVYQNPYQTRIDFGLAARSIQPQMTRNSASTPITVFGFAVAGRFQRDV